MTTQILSTDEALPFQTAVSEAVRLLNAGQVVALPTETVYGLAADALNPEAVARIFEAKERPSFDPLIVHLPHRKDLETIAEIPEAIAPVLRKITEALWPGPLTIILPRKACVPDIVTSGLPTVAVRLSKDPVFTRVVRAFNKPLAAPSANRFGSISPTSASAVKAELDGRIPLILDGGASNHGLESTIIKIEPNSPKPLITILRPGPITQDDLKPFGIIKLGYKPDKKVRHGAAPATSETAPEAPGMLASHYAPRTPLRLLESPDDFIPEHGKKYALLSYRGDADDGYMELTDWAGMHILSPGKGKLIEAGVRLFYALRQLDQLGVDEIIAEPLTEHGIGAAIMDRLRRASIKRQ